MGTSHFRFALVVLGSTAAIAAGCGTEEDISDDDLDQLTNEAEQRLFWVGEEFQDLPVTHANRNQFKYGPCELDETPDEYMRCDEPLKISTRTVCKNGVRPRRITGPRARVPGDAVAFLDTVVVEATQSKPRRTVVTAVAFVQTGTSEITVTGRDRQLTRAAVANLRPFPDGGPMPQPCRAGSGT